jgi:peptidyl-prolyl cis-trans isomerase C
MPRLLWFPLVFPLVFSVTIQAQMSQPHLSNPVVATVGSEKITRSMVDSRAAQLPANLPPDKLARARTELLEAMMFKILEKEYLRANNVPCTQKDLEEVQQQLEFMAQKNPAFHKTTMKKQEVETWARSIHLRRETTSPENVDALIQAHPDYFNGTKVCAGHILIPCPPLASTKEQKTAHEQARRLQTDIRAGQISFADAARRYSSCPSKEKGGDLGEFAFSDMVPPFARAAFDAKVGDVTDIVRTRFGFHLLHVTARSEGTQKPGPRARIRAKQLLLAELQNRIFDQALTTVPIVIFKDANTAESEKTTSDEAK